MIGALGGAAAGLLWSVIGREKHAQPPAETAESQPEDPDPVAEVLDAAKARLEEGRSAYEQGVAEARRRLKEELAQARRKV